MNRNSLKTMNAFIPFIWKTYVLFILGSAALSILMRLPWLNRANQKGEDSDRIILVEIGKSFCELFLSTTLWLVASIVVVSQFDDRFFFGARIEEFDDYVFLVCNALALILPFYSLMWALECVFRPLDRFLQDKEHGIDQRHMTNLVRRVAVPLILVGKFCMAVIRGYASYMSRAKP